MAGDDGGRDYAFEGLAVPAELNRVHDLIARAAADHPEVPPTDLMLFETAVVEIANNVVAHGGPPGQVEWRLTVVVGADTIEADLRDTGAEFTPARNATMPEPEAERGRGLAIAQAILDGMDVDSSAEGNHWRLVRRFTPA